MFFNNLNLRNITLKTLGMRTKLLLFAILFFGKTIAQESFKKTYHVPSKYIFENGDELVLMKEEKVMFKDLTKEEQETIRKKYPIGTKIRTEREDVIDGKKVIVLEEIVVDESFYEKQSLKKNVPVDITCSIDANVKLVENKLFINPALPSKKAKIEKRELYSFEMKNRQTIKLRFNEFTVSGLIIPLKYRFRDESKNIAEEFSVSANANLFVGFSMGKTSFHYREKVDNLSNTWKFTFGGFLGASSIKLNAGNTSASTNPLTSEQTKGAATFGLGIGFTLNKINLGSFMGMDYAFGDDASKWNYNKKPWLGVAIGYSLFNL
ncbi:hypothetical protein GCM10011508_18880 [Flavobacterium lutivivi]|nr:hypothetical protein GCM10011508_18880 [Flavobacterium lutivivi]